MTGRIERLQALLAEPLVVTNPVNIRYLSGLSTRNAALLVEAERALLFAAGRDAERARRLRRVELVETDYDLDGALARTLSGRVGFEAEHLTYERFRRLQEAGLELVPRRGLVEGLRAVKDEAELAAVRRAAALTSEAFSRLAEEPLVGRSEREIAWRMLEIFHELGAEEAAFPVTVAVGETASSSSAPPGDRRLEPGEAVVVDAGCRIGGYCSDCARTFAAGPVDRHLEEAHAVAVQALEEALAALVPGVELGAVDRAARSVAEERGLGDRLGRSLCHGVGLEPREPPILPADEREAVAPGTVVALEPAVYLADRGGVRVEDLVLVTESGPQVLTPLPRELIEVH